MICWDTQSEKTALSQLHVHVPVEPVSLKWWTYINRVYKQLCDVQSTYGVTLAMVAYIMYVQNNTLIVVCLWYI